MPRAVLFDLDDTLFDHEGCARDALHAVYGTHDCFAAMPFADVLRAHAEALEELHARVVAGELGIDEARVARFERIFRSAGRTVERTTCEAAARQYRSAYVGARRPVAGACALLAALKPRAAIAVVSNNLLAEQQEKMRVCRFDAYVDALVVSEEAGVAKPDPAIFRVALDRLGCRPEDAVMIGDSWAADITGAAAAGIPAIWFNPRRRPAPGHPAGVPQLPAFEPVEHALDAIFQPERLAGAHRS